MRAWKILENSRPGLNRISLEVEPNKEGWLKWVNAGNKEDLKYFLTNKEITNLEYLEGIELLKEVKSS
jgi:hypothetical protein